MEIIIQPDADAASEVAARLFIRQVREKPASVLGLATGGTPLRLYGPLVERAPRAGAGLQPRHQLSTSTNMSASGRSIRILRMLHAGAPVLAPQLARGGSPSPRWACGWTFRRIARLTSSRIRDAGGIDLQLLGLGSDGHLGFNEPGSSLASRTRIKTLTRGPAGTTRVFSGGRAGAAPRHHDGFGHHHGQPRLRAAGLRPRRRPKRSA